MGLGISRFGSQAGGGGSFTVQNGLNQFSPTIGELGGTLLHNTNIDQNSFTLSSLGGAVRFIGSNGSIGTSSFGAGIQVEASGNGSVAMGTAAKATDTNSHAYGPSAYSLTSLSMAAGGFVTANAVSSSTIGWGINGQRLENNNSFEMWFGYADGTIGKIWPDIRIVGGTPIGGLVGIGNINPTARLHLMAGSSEPNSSALKFEQGIPLAIPEPGAVAWSGTRLTIDDNTPTRKTIAYTSDIPSLGNTAGQTFPMAISSAAITIYGGGGPTGNMLCAAVLIDQPIQANAMLCEVTQVGAAGSIKMAIYDKNGIKLDETGLIPVIATGEYLGVLSFANMLNANTLYYFCVWCNSNATAIYGRNDSFTGAGKSIVFEAVNIVGLTPLPNDISASITNKMTTCPWIIAGL